MNARSLVSALLVLLLTTLAVSTNAVDLVDASHSSVIALDADILHSAGQLGEGSHACADPCHFGLCHFGHCPLTPAAHDGLALSEADPTRGSSNPSIHEDPFLEGFLRPPRLA